MVMDDLGPKSCGRLVALTCHSLWLDCDDRCWRQYRANCDFATLDIVRLGPLEDEDATKLVEQLALRRQVRITDETRDLLLQQLRSNTVPRDYAFAGRSRTKPGTGHLCRRGTTVC